jgi:hypothetical protein
MNTPYDVYYFDNFIENYARMIEKPVVMFRSYGWNHSTDVDAINASYAVYEDILPTDLWTSLKQSEYVFMEVSDLDDTILFLESCLPSSQAETATPENYIFYSLCNAQGQIIASNE